jgi:hypothetical protein
MDDMDIGLLDYLEHGWNDVFALHGLDLLPAGPNVPQEQLLQYGNFCKALGQF